MLEHVSKSARFLAVATCLTYLNGCASDGGASELAAMGLLLGGAATGNTGLATAGVAGYAGIMLAAPLLSDDSETEVSTVPAVSTTTNGTQTAVASTTVSVAPPTSQGKLGVEVETLSTSMGTAVGLKPAKGALVIATTKGGTGDKGGLKALDVIVEVAGQPVVDTASLQAIVGNMRAGYKAPVRVWRGHAFKDLAVEVARSTPSSAIATSALATPPPVKTQLAESAKPEKTRNFCLAYLAIENTYGAIVSPIQEKHNYDGSGSAMLASLKSYVAKVKQEQPGIWGEFDNGVISCESDTYVCMAQTKGGLFTKKQTAGQFCHYTLAEAETELAQMRVGDPSLKTVAWP
ncbi:PDZ domain-containing protein [Pseudomonas sp. DSV-1]|uniref:PDZ domain-containing protein n=1 Tax=Pseudomonas sp. DSV-1 TaxID=3112250 RepID=UPI002DB83100|nr:PDZ domain-containing protein [Pseudomonas sp. DSV-1]MEC4239114.1 PDZ domain-containing protein [Pseudomonas sp. DSV-1]